MSTYEPIDMKVVSIAGEHSRSEVTKCLVSINIYDSLVSRPNSGNATEDRAKL